MPFPSIPQVRNVNLDEPVKPLDDGYAKYAGDSFLVRHRYLKALVQMLMVLFIAIVSPLVSREVRGPARVSLIIFDTSFGGETASLPAFAAP